MEKYRTYWRKRPFRDEISVEKNEYCLPCSSRPFRDEISVEKNEYCLPRSSRPFRDGICDDEKTSFSPYFTNKTTLVASKNTPQSQPYYLIKNEVIRSIMGGHPFSTEIVLLKKLCRNEVAILTNRQEPQTSNLKPQTPTPK